MLNTNGGSAPIVHKHEAVNAKQAPNGCPRGNIYNRTGGSIGLFDECCWKYIGRQAISSIKRMKHGLYVLHGITPGEDTV